MKKTIFIILWWLAVETWYAELIFIKAGWRRVMYTNLFL